MTNETRVAVLYAQGKSVYKTLPGCDVYDIERDARNYYGPWPVVAHPPCAQWSILRGLSRPRIEIAKYLAFHALECVEAFGGALEHPAGSAFWSAAGLPKPTEASDRGVTVAVKHTWFGGPVAKPTWLFVANVTASELPELPFSLAEPTHVVGSSSRNRAGRKLAYLPKSQRETTPKAMAEWLIEAAILSGSRSSALAAKGE